MNHSQPHHATYNPKQQMHASESNFAVHNSGMSAFVQAWVPPSVEEQKYYDLLFTQVDDQHRNAIYGQQAVAFFARSHLDKTILREVWSIADAQRRSQLSRNEFYVAMRLISMGQRGEQVSLQRFSQFAAMLYPLPMIEGMPPPLERQQPPTSSQQNYALQPGAGSLHQPPTGPYALTADEKRKYDNVFQQYDTDHDGYVMGTEAATLFQMSGLDRNVLRTIWSMADISQDSKLSAPEFYVAMHLIVCVSKRGLPIPATLPRELCETAFGSGGAFQPGLGSQMSRTPSQIGMPVQKQQESVLPPKPEGMAAFDSFFTVNDTPLPSLAPSAPQENSIDFVEGSSTKERAGEYSTSLPIGGFGCCFTPHTPEVSSERARTGSASSVNSMSSFPAMASVPPQPPIQQLSSRDFGSHERTQMPHTHTATFQAPQQMHRGFESERLGAQLPSAGTLETKFLEDDEGIRLVGQLARLTEQVVQVLADVELKQTTIEITCEKIQDLDELRHDLVTLVMKREDLRSTTSAAGEDSSQDQSKVVLARTLQSLVENQKQIIQQLQCDIACREDELEEAILSAQLQQITSLEPQSLSTASESLSVSTRDAVGAAHGEDDAASAPLALDATNLLPSPVAAPSAPSISAFSSDTTDNIGFNAFSNFDPAPPSSAMPLSTDGIPSHSLFSPNSSPLPTATAFGDFAFADPPLSDVREPPAKELPGSHDDATFDAFGPTRESAETPVSSLSPVEAPYLPSTLSPSIAVADELGIHGLGHFNATSSSVLAAASENSLFSPAGAIDVNPGFGASVDTAATFECSPFLTPSAMQTLDFDAFAAAPISTDNAVSQPNTRTATEELLLSPVAANKSRSNTLSNGCGALNDATATSESAKSTGSQVFSSSFAPAAASISSGLDAFNDLDAPAASTKRAKPISAREIMPENASFSPVASDFDGVGVMNTASASADSATLSLSLGKWEKKSADSPFSPVASTKDPASSNFKARKKFHSPPVSTFSAAEILTTDSRKTPSLSHDDGGFGNFTALEGSSNAPALTAERPEIPTAADLSDPPTADNISGLGDFGESPSTKPYTMKPADTMLPVDTTEEIQFEEFGTFNAAPASTDHFQPKASSNFEAFDDFSC